MSDQYDINRLLAEAKNAGIDPSGVPLLGQQVPVMHGIPVNGKVMTIYDLEEMSDVQFRELFLAAIISLAGGVYAPPPPPTNEGANVNEDTEVPVTEPVD